MKIRFISIFLMNPLLLSSCLQEEVDNIRVPPNRANLFYMAGDNSLGGETQEKISDCHAFEKLENNKGEIIIY